jgi:hypothetical protein
MTIRAATVTKAQPKIRSVPPSGAAMGNSRVPAIARAERSPPNSRLPDRNNPAAPRNQIPRCGTAKASPQTASVAAAWSIKKLAAVCSLGSGTPCAAAAAKITPPAPVSPAAAAAAHAHLRIVQDLWFTGRTRNLIPSRRTAIWSSHPPAVRRAMRRAADAACKSRKARYRFLIF